MLFALSEVTAGSPDPPSTNRRRGLSCPEVWFRIVHLSAHHVNGCAELSEQTVEVALGPAGAFDNGNMGRADLSPTVASVCAKSQLTPQAQ